MTEPVLKEHQPDLELPEQHPSLFIYFFIIALASIFVVLAFILNGGPDWPSLFLNVSAGLISALVVLIVVERRLRASELSALSQVPVKAQMSATTLFSPTARAARNYASSQLQASRPLLSSYVVIEKYTEHESSLLAGCNLLAGPGVGKTAWMQFVVAKHAKEFLDSDGRKKIVVLFPLRQWRQPESLEDAVIGHIMQFASCSEKPAKKLLRQRVSTLILDGYDEIYHENSFFSDYQELVSIYQSLCVSVSTTPEYPCPLKKSPVVDLPELSREEIDNIRLARAKKKRKNNRHHDSAG